MVKKRIPEKTEVYNLRERNLEEEVGKRREEMTVKASIEKFPMKKKRGRPRKSEKEEQEEREERKEKEERERRGDVKK